MRSLSILSLALAFALFGCAGQTDPDAITKAGLENYAFTMVQGPAPQPGKPVVIEFWATWCGPCHQLFPHLSNLVTQLEETDIQFVAVTNEPFNLTRDFITGRQLKYPVASDVEDKYGRALNVTYIPFAVIVDAKGKILWSGHSGKLSRKRIENVLEANS